MSAYKVGDWVHTDERDRGTGQVVVDLERGLYRVRFGRRTEVTMRASVLRPATDEETAAAQDLVR